MRFITRSLLGLFLLILTVGLLAMAGNTVFTAYTASQEDDPRRRQARERVFTVEVSPIELQTHAPEIQTYGEVISGRTLELRAAAGGQLVQISPNFREGGRVKRGEILFQTDPASALSKLNLARADLSEAKADLEDAIRDLELAKDEIIAAQNQLDLRNRAMTRQRSLRERGVGTDTSLETAELAAAASEQTLLSKRLSLSQSQARISRAQTTVARRQISFDDAQRMVKDTTVTASFDGVLSDVSAVLGRLVNANEKLGNLIDPEALEVAFRVSNEEFQNLTDTDDQLPQAQIRLSLSGPNANSMTARIDRVGAAVGAGKTGREIFASIGRTPTLNIRPGDFVSVSVTEPPLDNVALLPAAATASDGGILLVGDANRLEEAQVEIVRKQGDQVLVRADGLQGRQFVRARAPQLGAGILVQPRAVGTAKIEAPEMVQLSAERRDALIAAIDSRTQIPEPVRAKLKKRLQETDVPKELVERLEDRFGAGGGTDKAPPETVTLTDDQRKNMIAFVEASKQIPADRKTRILQALNQPDVPKQMFDRINARMGS